MPQKVILTSQQHDKIINHILNEITNLDENLWQDVKYGLSKLGRYKAGGRIMGKGQVDRDAVERIKAIIDKKGNEVIQRLNTDIENLDPEFPNSRRGVDFLDTVMKISAVYDSIVEATHKNPSDAEYLPVDAANGLINDLREYVKKFMDIDLKSIYSVVDEVEGNTIEIDEDAYVDPDVTDKRQYTKGNNVTVGHPIPSKATTPEPAPKDAPQPAPEPEQPLFFKGNNAVRQHLQGKRGDGDDFDSERMKGLNVGKLSPNKTALAVGAFAGLQAILGPIAILPVAGGALVNLMKKKGQKQSRAKTLNDLYQSMRNIPGGEGIIPQDSQEKPNVPRGGDELYNSIKNLFKFIVFNRKSLGVRSADNVGTGTPPSSGFKAGDSAIYTTNKGEKKTVKIVNPVGATPDQTIVQMPNQNGTSPVKTSSLMKIQSLSEGKYIKDIRTLEYLHKNLSYDKLKSFEEFIKRIEAIRNQIKNAEPEDKVLMGFIKKIKTNPIMATDFVKMFNIPSNDPKAVNSLKSFINDMFVTIYSGKFKYGNMIDKMAKLGESMELSEVNSAFLKDAQDRGRFKNNLMTFLTDIINIFQYLSKSKQ